MSGSGVGGTAAFTETPEGAEVVLSVRGLPDPGVMMYLSHIHPGTCAEEGRGRRAGEDVDHSREGEPHEGEVRESEVHESEAGHDDEHVSGISEIEYPLTPVVPDAEGNGSSTTVLEGVTADELFSGEPKYVTPTLPAPGTRRSWRAVTYP